MSFANIGKVWSLDSFKQYLKSIKKPVYAKSITIHHTGAPSLAQRPRGFVVQHIHNICSYYRSLGWSKGPHLFIDEDQIFGMTPLTSSGIHAVSFNRNSIGIEILGNYDVENPLDGRGLQCMKMAAGATLALGEWLDIPLNETTVKFHRDDPKTRKSCPGKKVDKAWFLSLVREARFAQLDQSTLDDTEYVGVIEYAVKKGISQAQAIRRLSSSKGMTFFDKIWIESARYNSAKQTTFAKASELDTIF
jgi:hypothetical protein